MAKINLRPWREERSEQRRKQFLTNVVASIILGGVLVFAMGYYFDFMKERQNSRNGFLRTEIAKLDEQIKEIKKLKEQKARLLERLNAIEELQGTRPLIVRTFDELVRVMPDDLYYSSISKKGEKISITGNAGDNIQVSNLMRNMDTSVWFGEPNLSKVTRQGNNVKNFVLAVDTSKPNPEVE